MVIYHLWETRTGSSPTEENVNITSYSTSSDEGSRKDDYGDSPIFTLFDEDLLSEHEESASNDEELDFSIFSSISTPGFFPFVPPAPGSAHRPAQLYQPLTTILPNAFADVSCSNIKPLVLLNWVNRLPGTRFVLTPGADACLREFIKDGCDLGLVYGYLRPWLRPGHPRDLGKCALEDLPARMHKRSQIDNNQRAVCSRCYQRTVHH